MKNFINDYVKAARRQSRDEEIELYGKQIRHNNVQESKKAYKRKKFRYHDDE